MLPQYLVTSHIFGHANRILCCRHKEDRSLFLFSFFFMEGQKPNNNLKRSHIAKVCYFLYNLFWLCLSFPLHIFFFLPSWWPICGWLCYSQWKKWPFGFNNFVIKNRARWKQSFVIHKLHLKGQINVL